MRCNFMQEKEDTGKYFLFTLYCNINIAISMYCEIRLAGTIPFF